jgi:hypothetical protein
MEGLRRRDEYVLRTCCEYEVPAVTVMSGGYGEDINDTVEIHCNTIRMVRNVLASQQSMVDPLSWKAVAAGKLRHKI